MLYCMHSSTGTALVRQNQANLFDEQAESDWLRRAAEQIRPSHFTIVHEKVTEPH